MSREHDPADDTRDDPEVAVNVNSMYGHRTRRGLVKLEIGKAEWIFSPAEARRIARLLGEAAEGADTDEFLMEQFMGVVGLSERAAATMLREFRDARKVKYGDRI